MANGKISGDPIASTAVDLNMAAIQGGASVQAPSSLFAAVANNLSDLSDPAAALTNLGGLSSALAASTYLTQVNAASTYLTIAAAGAGYQPLDADLTSWAGVTRAAGFDTFTATPSSANLLALLTTKTGTGSSVFSISPTFTGTPAAPTAAVDTNTTQLATTAMVLAQAAAATPLRDMATAAVGTSTRFARADHVHPGREVLTAARTYYVRTDGSDSNTGLVNNAGGAFLTLQKAYTVIRDTLDLAGFTPTIKAGASGTFTAGLDIRGQLTGAGPTALVLEGDLATPANVILSTTNASGVICGKGGYVKVTGVKMVTTTSGSGLIAYDGGQIDYETVDFGACAQYHTVSYNAGRVQPTGNYTISGSALAHWHAYLEGLITGASITITLTGTPAFAGSFAACAFANIGISGITFSGAATGLRYLVHKGGLIDVSGQGETYLPGNTQGICYENGIYVGSQPMGTVQSVLGTYATNAAISAVIPLDDTIPQISEGTQIISVSITPKSQYSKMRCTFSGMFSGDVSGIFMAAAIFQNATANAICARAIAAPQNNYPVDMTMVAEFTPSSVAAQTITVRVGPSSNNLRLNGTAAARFYGGAAQATLLVEEIATAVP